MSSAKVLVFSAWLLMMAGCRQDMHDQPRYRPLDESTFFADARSARPTPPHTVARSAVLRPGPEQTGMIRAGQFTEQLPVALTRELVLRGRERFDIYCSPCHGLNADGNGMVALRGVRAPPSLITDRVRRMPVGYIFAVVTNGFGGMPDYDDQIPVRDRWAIVTYLRALQLREQASVADVPAEKRAELDVQQ